MSIPALLSVLLLIGGGCGPESVDRLRFAQVIGSQGHSSGKFNRPRGLVGDDRARLLYVVDWDGRIQKFTYDGAFRASWIMPEVERGKPEDLCLTQRGTLLVADTHYHRIVEFDTRGTYLGEFGAYGKGPGQFIYPVGICQDGQGFVYVSEYGENDRVQKFTDTGEFVAQWGSFGPEPGQFQRPSGLAIGPDELLYVADAVNHRVQVFTLAGELVRVIGEQGKALGQFTYPYDVGIHRGRLFVLEYGSQRVQELTLTGEPLAAYGHGGSGEGAFAAPWRMTATAAGLFISDTDNHRVVQLIPSPAVGPTE